MTETPAPPGEALREYYDAYWGPSGNYPGYEPPKPLMAALSEAVGGSDRVLDFGCGDGRIFGGWLRDRAQSYLGVDISSTAVDRAKEQGLEAATISSEREIPRPDASFDTVVCLEVLEHLVEPHRAAAEILRVLTPGGRLVATVPNLAYWRFRLDLALFGRWNPLGDDESVAKPWRDPHLRFFTRRTLARMLTEAGFTDVEVRGCNGAFLADIPLLRRLGTGRRGSPLFRLLERLNPSLFSVNLVATGRRPAGGRSNGGAAAQLPSGRPQ